MEEVRYLMGYGWQAAIGAAVDQAGKEAVVLHLGVCVGLFLPQALPCSIGPGAEELALQGC